MIILSMNTIPERGINLNRILQSFINQKFDEFYINFVGYEETDKELKEKFNFLSDDRFKYVRFLRCTGAEWKFVHYEKLKNIGDYYFTLDDDILYPRNYIERMISISKRYEDKCVIAVHASVYNTPFQKDMYRNKKLYFYFKELEKDLIAHQPGTGVMLTPYFSNLKIDVTAAPKNMADAYMTMLLHEANIQIICPKRKHGWIRCYNERNIRLWGSEDRRSKINNYINYHLIEKKK